MSAAITKPPLSGAPPIDRIALELGSLGRSADGIAASLSAVAAGADALWVASDQSTGVLRLDPVRRGWRVGGSFDLREHLDLPKLRGDTMEIEGLAIDGDRLWVTGSHALRRRQGQRLPVIEGRLGAQLRHLIACIDLAPGDDGRPVPAGGRFVAFRGDGNRLTESLRHDPVLAPFLGLPGGENGLDVEGIAARGDRAFLGLRGPVIDGKAVVIDLAVEPRGDRHLALLHKQGPRAPWCALDLDGLGIRDLARDGADLLLLAGPTMRVEAPARLFRWRGAFEAKTGAPPEPGAVAALGEIAVDPPRFYPEGMTLLSGADDAKTLLFVYDSRAPARHPRAGVALADLLPLPEPASAASG